MTYPRLLKWAGSKAKEAPDIFRACRLDDLEDGVSREEKVCEMFAGSAAFTGYRALGGPAAPEPWAPPTLLIDVNPALMALFRVVRDRPLALVDQYLEWYLCCNGVMDRAFYAKVRDELLPQNYELVRAAALLFLNRSSWNGLYRTNKEGRNNVPPGLKEGEPLAPVDEAAIDFWHLALQQTRLVCGDFTMCWASDADVFFVDPPYPEKFTGYATEAGQVDMVHLAQFCEALVKRGKRVVATLPGAEELMALWTPFCDVLPLERHSQMGALTAGDHAPLGQVMLVSR
jgi:DNA adenine methylase